MTGGPKAKIDRADKHVQHLSRLIRAFAKQTYRIDAHPDLWETGVSKGEILIYAEATTEPPDEVWGPIIGDAIHNLRSALDQVVWTLSVTYQASVGTAPPPDPIPIGDPWRRVAFPIRTDPMKWSAATASGKTTGPLWAVDPNLFASFQRLQPFVTGQNAPELEPLAMLEELWNIDKHRHLHLVNVTVELGDVLPVNPFSFPLPAPLGTFEVVSKRPAGPLVGRAEVGRARHVKVPGGILGMSVPQVHMDPQLVIDVAFEQGTPGYGGRSVLHLLRDLRQTVKKIVAAF